LHGIALNLVRTNYRSHERATRAQDHLTRIQATHGAAVEPEGELADQHRTRVLYAMLDKLTAPLREAFVLRYVHGMTAAEAATALGIEPGAVRVRAHRAREQLEAEVARLHAAAIAKGEAP
jgi:RNA polymerase sigma-70 factor (ECF subfamily)